MHAYLERVQGVVHGVPLPRALRLRQRTHDARQQLRHERTELVVQRPRQLFQQPQQVLHQVRPVPVLVHQRQEVVQVPEKTQAQDTFRIKGCGHKPRTCLLEGLQTQAENTFA
jgi:hypothetical protein